MLSHRTPYEQLSDRTGPRGRPIFCWLKSFSSWSNVWLYAKPGNRVSKIACPRLLDAVLMHLKNHFTTWAFRGQQRQNEAMQFIEKRRVFEFNDSVSIGASESLYTNWWITHYQTSPLLFSSQSNSRKDTLEHAEATRCRILQGRLVATWRLNIGKNSLNHGFVGHLDWIMSILTSKDSLMDLDEFLISWESMQPQDR